MDTTSVLVSLVVTVIKTFKKARYLGSLTAEADAKKSYLAHRQRPVLLKVLKHGCFGSATRSCWRKVGYALVTFSVANVTVFSWCCTR